jgi:glycosyltransferase involved in cell wall biosynthesis
MFVRRPLLSVVTAVRSGAGTIDRTIDSVVALKRRFAIEHIVVEGGSTDNTIDVLERRSVDLDIVHVAVPGGISEALNNGISCASGRFVTILGSDDRFNGDGAMQLLDRLQREDDAAVWVANVWLVDPTTGAQEHRRADVRQLRRYMSVYHAAMFVPLSIYRAIGVYDASFRYAMDCEWVHRAVARGITFKQANLAVACVQLRGTSHRHITDSMSEFRRSVTLHGLARPLNAAYYQVRQTLVQTLLRIGVIRALYLRVRRRNQGYP